MVCRKKATWSDYPKKLILCNNHSEKFSKFLEGKLPNNCTWKTVRGKLVQKFLKLQISYLKRSKEKNIKTNRTSFRRQRTN